MTENVGVSIFRCTISFLLVILNCFVIVIRENWVSWCKIIRVTEVVVGVSDEVTKWGGRSPSGLLFSSRFLRSFHCVSVTRPDKSFSCCSKYTNWSGNWLWWSLCWRRLVQCFFMPTYATFTIAYVCVFRSVYVLLIICCRTTYSCISFTVLWEVSCFTLAVHLRYHVVNMLRYIDDDLFESSAKAILITPTVV